MAFRVFLKKMKTKKTKKNTMQKESKKGGKAERRKAKARVVKNLRSQNNLSADVSSNQRKTSDSERVLICREESVAIDI